MGAGIGASIATFVRPSEPATVAVTANLAQPPPSESPAAAGPPVAVVAPALNAVTLSPADRRPRIAVVIDDVGVHVPNARRAIALPGPLTLSLMTYAADLPGLAAAARGRGHELMLHVPMEPAVWDVDPGPNVLLAGRTGAELQRRIDWALERIDGIDGVVGINNHMGSRFTADRAAMDVLMRALALRGLLFLDSVTTGHTVGRAASRAAGVAYLSRDVFLDNEETAEAVGARLRELEAKARRDGSAVAIGHPKAATLAALEAWLPTLAGRGFVLVPVSALVPAPGADLIARASR